MPVEGADVLQSHDTFFTVTVNVWGNPKEDYIPYETGYTNCIGFFSGHKY